MIRDHPAVGHTFSSLLVRLRLLNFHIGEMSMIERR